MRLPRNCGPEGYRQWSAWKDRQARMNRHLREIEREESRRILSGSRTRRPPGLKIPKIGRRERRLCTRPPQSFARPERRANGSKRVAGIEGTAAVFNSPANIGGLFVERIAPGAFDHLLDGDTVGLFNHDRNIVLGRTPATLELRADSTALRYRVPRMPKSRRDVLEAIQRGDVRGNSFSFSMQSEDDEEWRNRPGKLPLRIIHRVGALHDVGPVTFPAYKSTTVGAT